MKRQKIRLVISLQVATAVLFVALMAYLNLALFNLKKDQIETQSKDSVSETFFAIPYNYSGLTEYVDLLLTRVTEPVQIENLSLELNRIFMAYNMVPVLLDSLFMTMNLDLEYEWSVSVPRFELRSGAKVYSLIESGGDPQKELVLFGEKNIHRLASKTQFYKIGENHFGQINLYLRFTNIFKVIKSQMIPVFIVDFILILLFAWAIRYGIKTMLLQRKLIEQQNDFVNGVSHEFNTPLSSIRIGGQALLRLSKRYEDNIAQEFASGILRQQTNLQNLVDHILSMGITDSLDQNSEISWNSAKEIIPLSVEKWLDVQENSNINIKQEEFPEGFIGVDPHLFQLIVNNILDNSRKYRRGDETNINIGASIRKKRYVIVISDEGVGIPESEIIRVQAKFERGSHLAKGESKGLGLGLYLVRSILKRAGGHIEITSKINFGTKVHLCFPYRHGN